MEDPIGVALDTQDEHPKPHFHERVDGRRIVTLLVWGNAKPQGSKRHVGGGRMIEQVKGVGAWRADVAHAAREVAPNLLGRLMEGGLRMHVVFYRPRPKSAKKRKHPFTQPDSSKLLRAVEDAMQGILYRNDGQFCDTRVEKRFGEPARAVIRIEEME